MTRLLTILIIALPCITFGQFKVGPKAGLTLSQQSYESDFKLLKPGFEFGGLAHVPFTTRIYLQAEFLVTQKGYKEKYGSDQLFDQLTATYWQLPVMVQYRFGSGIEYYGALGVCAARWMSGTYRSRITEDGEVIEEDYEFTSSYNVEGFKDNRQEFGALISAGVILPISINHIVIDLRYNHGFTDTYDLQNEPSGYSKRTNGSLAITFGMLFSL